MPSVIQIDGWDPIAGAAVSICAASHDDPAVCHLNGVTWWPAIAKLPTLRYDLFDGAFGDQITAPSSTITLSTAPWGNFGRYILADARFRLWSGKTGDPWVNWTLRFDGRVSAQPKLQDLSAEIDFAADDRWLDSALLATFAGTTGAEGDATLKGTAKPLALGAPRYVAGKLIDSVNSVFQVHGYGAVQGFEAALEKLARFGAPIGDYPTYDALVAASIPAGQWATAKAVGMARFGAPPSGQISFLLQGDAAGPDGWVRTPGQLIKRLATLSGGGNKLDLVSLAALDAARPYNCSIYIDSQTTAREVIQKLAASVNAVAGVSWTGQLFAAPIGLGVATTTLTADGSALPPVRSVQQIDIASPYQKLAIGAQRAWTVHDLADIAFTATVVDKGLYAGATSYREGNVVNLSDGSRWLFVGTTPATGSTPSTSNANWSLISAPLAAVDSNGTLLTSLISNAQAAANSALADLARIGSDGYLNAGSEKRQAIQDWQAINNELGPIRAQADALQISRAIYDTAYNTLGGYLSSLSPAWNDTTQDTAIVAATWNGKWTDYYYAKVALINAIANAAAQSSGFVNLVPYSRFEKGANGGAWLTPAYNPGGIAADGGGAFLYNGKMIDKVGFNPTTTYAANSNQQVSIEQTNQGAQFWATVTPGQRVFASLLVETAHCGANACIVFAAADTSNQQATFFAVEFQPGAFPNSPLADWSPWRAYGFFTVPAGCTKAALRCYFHALDGQPGFGSIAEPMVCAVPPGQTTPPPFTPGPNADSGADITALSQHSLPQISDIHVAADYTGAIQGGQLPQSRTASHLVGQADVTTQANVTASASGGVAISVNNNAGDAQRGTITVNGGQSLPQQCTITGSSTYNGASLPFSFNVYRDDAAPPSNPGSGSNNGSTASGPASTSSFTAPGSNTSYVEMGRCTAVTTGSGGSVKVSCPLSFYEASEGSMEDPPSGCSMSAVVQWSNNGGGSWNNADGGHSSSYEAVNYYSVQPPKGARNSAGSIDAGVTINGLGAGASIVVRVLGASGGDGSGKITSVTGTMTATPS